jgi:antitoxin (DNA-binding transcriptional repressor) of toxin-antitoxin stability system
VEHIVNIHEAKTQLSKLIVLAERGDTVIIARGGVPAVKLVVEAPKNTPVFGLGKLQFPPLGQDAFAPLSTEAERDWYSDPRAA